VIHLCFSSPLLLFVCTAALAQSVKRPRTDASSPVHHDLNRVVGEQASIIESLKKDKSTVESSLASLKTDHEKISKENALFRRAVTIQQDRQNQAENQIKAAHQYRAGAEDQIKKMEQVILSLRYHLQTQQQSYGNDFMGNRPPDVF
jgi:septal ring factor EnvC (AmiA/AmiB activator)